MSDTSILSRSYLLIRLCRGGQLFDKIVQAGQFTENKAQAIFREIMYAVAYCHERGVAHRDLKPENFLLSTAEPDSPLKVIDFGLSFQFNKNSGMISSKKVMSTVVGTVLSSLVLLHGPGDTGRPL